MIVRVHPWPLCLWRRCRRRSMVLLRWVQFCCMGRCWVMLEAGFFALYYGLVPRQNKNYGMAEHLSRIGACSLHHCKHSANLLEVLHVVSLVFVWFYEHEWTLASLGFQNSSVYFWHMIGMQVKVCRGQWPSVQDYHCFPSLHACSMLGASPTLMYVTEEWLLTWSGTKSPSLP